MLITLHIDIDSFFIAVERLEISDFKGIPLLIGGISSRGVVASCSYEARAYGVRSAMPMRVAKRLCPVGLVIRGDMDRYTNYSRMIGDVLSEYVPAFERASIDEFYVDLSGASDYVRNFGAWGTEVRKRVYRETGLPISMGLSSNKTVSKIATGQSKPSGQLFINPNSTKEFLASLSIKHIPSVGSQTYQTLRNMGIEEIRSLQQVSPDLLMSVLGKKLGYSIWQKAQGIDYSPVVPYSEQKSFSTEVTFTEDTIDVHFLEASITSMTEQLAFKLRNEQQLTSCVTVKIRYSDYQTYTKQRHIGYASATHTLLAVVKALFYSLYDRRVLVRHVGVKFSHLVHGNYQIHLFEDTVERVSLYQSMDAINRKYGADAIGSAKALGVKRYIK
ncbi:DNA polymerase IV [Cytophagales bacterium LB-30]|uniref:DNA polymerase IV n=1 Tax=Shiella aurantiaca TaxID=3058365 RepID=A0ABT8F855_9BACT|nr:DNA polymerase IV [Shiella aurantiaca]MDN4166419.1 DNA polymerase IV [Shiella aurantiaca]